MKGKLEINEVDLEAFKAATAESYDTYLSSQGDEYLKMVKAAAQ